MKKKIFIISMLCSSSALAKNAVIEEVLALEDESVSTLLSQLSVDLGVTDLLVKIPNA